MSGLPIVRGDHEGDASGSPPERSFASQPRPLVVANSASGSGDVLVAWPLCPACHRGRSTICPYCKTTGDEFPRGDDAEREWNADGGGLPLTAKPSADDPEATPLLRVICPTCDEPFTPEFFDECAWCGHEFPDGRPTPNRLRKMVHPPRREWTPRDVALVWMLIGAAALIFGYFGWIAQR